MFSIGNIESYYSQFCLKRCQLPFINPILQVPLQNSILKSSYSSFVFMLLSEWIRMWNDEENCAPEN